MCEKMKVTLKKTEGWTCLVCDELYSENIDGESWIQCLKCKEWAHEKCVNVRKIYICVECKN